ncbi:MAG: anthranilate synthase component 1 [Nanoarchaeota archaeon]|nr:anthranilate synthase component 1 [Nanoarchaeota archaeon]
MQSIQKLNLNGNTEYFRNLLKQVKVGSMIPLFKVIEKAIDPVELFARISDYGRKENSVFLESAAIVQKYGENSIGSADPCLRLSGKDDSFSIKALNQLGERFLEYIKQDFDFCDSLVVTQTEIKGKLKPQRKNVSEKDRLMLKTHMDIIRIVAFKFQPIIKPFACYGGLFGAISYDFIDQFEDLPKNKKSPIENKDYEFFFLDNLFFVNHEEKKTYIVSNAMKMDEDNERLFDECLLRIENYERALENRGTFKIKKKKKISERIESDTSEKEYLTNAQKIKEHIKKGDIFQCVYSRTLVKEYNEEPLDIYQRLKSINPSPYMFFENFGNTILLGASPEMQLRVEGIGDKKSVELRPIAGTRPRGIINDNIDPELDSRYEIDIKTDEKEIAEHTMLVDLARSDVAKISVPGTRIVDESYIVEKYSHVQHLVSNVKGVLKPGLDCLHAYLATMNMGTLTGAPKVRAMEFIRKYENTKRGFYGGAVLYITPSKDMDSCIVIRSMTLQDNKAYVRAGAGIVFDSVAENEFDETKKKAMACMKSLDNNNNYYNNYGDIHA